jgi:hypothetical protein
MKEIEIPEEFGKAISVFSDKEGVRILFEGGILYALDTGKTYIRFNRHTRIGGWDTK